MDAYGNSYSFWVAVARVKLLNANDIFCCHYSLNK